MILDPAITLFGKTIQLNDSAAHHTQTQQFTGIHLIKEVAEDELLMENDKVDNPSEDGMDDMDDESTDTTALQQQQQQQQQTTTTTKKKKKDAKAGGKDEKEWDDETKKEELKKPDKILPCPRCKSMDTKFCYYNNYNVNQPRHFCKACQRYWTAGGTMRNVPVGAGRRKNKTSAAAARPCPSHFTLPDESTHHGTTVLTFGSENRDDRSSTASTLTTASASVSVSMEDQSIKDPGFAIANPMQCYQGPYMWHPAVPFCPPVFPVPVFHHPYWNGSPVPWNVPLVPHPNSPQPTTLGKHTRDGEIIAAPTSTSNVLTPKTLRIDDPDEAAKSSIWTTLGIRKDNKGDCVSKGFFNSIQTKDESEKKECEAAAAAACYKANPVALCRSANFQEAA